MLLTFVHRNPQAREAYRERHDTIGIKLFSGRVIERLLGHASSNSMANNNYNSIE